MTAQAVEATERMQQDSTDQQITDARALLDGEQFVRIIGYLEREVAYSEERLEWWEHYYDEVKAKVELLPANHPNRKKLEDELSEASVQITIHRLIVDKSGPLIAKRRARLDEKIKRMKKLMIDLEQRVKIYDEALTRELNQLLTSDQEEYEKMLEVFNDKVKTRRKADAQLKIVRARLQIIDLAEKIRSCDAALNKSLEGLIEADDANYEWKMQIFSASVQERRQKEIELQSARSDQESAELAAS